jgi:hypothetical protein
MTTPQMTIDDFARFVGIMVDLGLKANLDPYKMMNELEVQARSLWIVAATRKSMEPRDGRGEQQTGATPSAEVG